MRSRIVIGDAVQTGNRELGKGRFSTRLRRILLGGVILLGALFGELGPGALPAGAGWIEPVSAPVVDPFRPPTTRYGRGNRGLEYGDSEGLDVIAVDGGRVVFSGMVARHRHIVVAHGSGLRSTYAYLESSVVTRGQAVRQGQYLGRAASGFHLTARLGDVYVDPALLFAGAEVVLALTDSPPPSVRADQRSLGYGEMNGLPDPPHPGLFRGLWTLAGSAYSLNPSQVLLDTMAAAETWYHQDCSAVGGAGGRGDLQQFSQSGAGRVLIQVGGLGSQAGEASIGTLDAASLGYDPDNIAGFSYAGGCTPEAFGLGPPSPYSLTSDLAASESGPGASSYEAGDTYQSMEISAARLADLIESTAMARPGIPIDIAAHSLGGVVTRRALEILDGREAAGTLAEGAMPSVVVTIGSPHRGVPLADGAEILSDRLAGPLLPLVAPDWIESDVVRELARSGPSSLDQPGYPPDGVRVVSLAGSGDLIVPAPATIWPGATNTLVLPREGSPVGHSDLPSHPDVAVEFGLALGGMAARCVTLVDVLAGTIAGSGISVGEQAASTAIGIGRWLL